MKIICLSLIALLGAACGGDGIDSNEAARRAYLGLDTSIEKSLTLGFAGFNAASSANIDPQMTTGTVAGTLVITGQVDQGASTNKGMRLSVGMVDYTDGAVVIEGEEEEINITYDTSTDPLMQPLLNLTLRNIPTGTLDGTLTGVYVMTGDVEGEATLNLTFSGTLQMSDTGGVSRVPGKTVVTGTASTGDGMYEVDVTL
jgi:hypothetical protein